MTTLTAAAAIVIYLRERRDVLLDILETQALADPLTGLPNRRSFDRELGSLISWARRSGAPVALLTVDVDRFKRINDTWGHAVGDDALRVVAEALTAAVRESDFVARLGGDEFVVLLRSDSTGAARVAEAARARVAAADLPGGAITLSIGVAVFPEHADDADGLLAASDAALYEAKIGGRNRTACAAAPVPDRS